MLVKEWHKENRGFLTMAAHMSASAHRHGRELT